MKKRLFIFIIFVLSFQLFTVPFLYVEAGNNEAPKVCNGPSEMMSHYFNFQGEMKAAILGTQINSERFSASFGAGGLFTNRVLTFNGPTAIELLSSSVVGNIKSFVSNSITSVFLLELAFFSVVQSNTEGFAILFADWPIVRDYKKMLDIETDIFDIAYFRSKQVNITRQIEPNSAEKIKEIIKKYQDLGLLTGENFTINGSMADILLDLQQMNAVMKQFIMVGGEKIGKAGLRKYNGCLGNLDINECDNEHAILKFTDKAINDLYEDYKGVRGMFGGCNSYGNYIQSTLTKTVNNNLDSVSTAIQNVEDAMDRLGSALFNKKRWDFRDPCKDLSDYEMTQLLAYWGGNWKCGEGINLFTTKSYIKDKVAHSKQKKKGADSLKKSVRSKDSGKSSIEKGKTNSERAQIYKKVVGVGEYNKYYDFALNSGFTFSFETMMDKYYQAQENAISTDVSGLFSQIRGLLDQVDRTNNETSELKIILKNLEGKQCSN